MEAKVEKVKCQLCGREVPLKESYVWSGFRICEDCYFERSSPVRTCDPWAVYSAKQALKISGAKAEEILTEDQKRIYSLVKTKGKVTIEELLNQLKIPRHMLEAHIATLRHLELIKGLREGNKTYIVPFQT